MIEGKRFLTFRIKFAVTVHLLPFVLRILKSISVLTLNIWPGHLDLVLIFFTRIKNVSLVFFFHFSFTFFHVSMSTQEARMNSRLLCTSSFHPSSAL